MKFLINCGGCQHWGCGVCSKLVQERHNRRELCPEVWLKETARLGKLLGRDIDQVKHLGMTLDPMRTWEAVGATWPAEEKPKKAKTKKKAPGARQAHAE